MPGRSLVGWERRPTTTALSLMSLSYFGLRLQHRGRSGSELEPLFEVSPLGQLILEPDLRVSRANPAALALLGQAADALSGRRLPELVSPESREALAAALLSTTPEGPPPPPQRVLGLRPDGAEAVWEVTAIRDASSDRLAVVLIDLQPHDALVAALTERGAQLARSNEALQEFSRAASHDLQEPLRMISSFTELLERRYHGKFDADADEFLKFAHEGAVRLQRILDDLVLYARIDSRGLPFALVSMNACVRHARDGLRVVIEETGGSVEIADLPDLEGDESQLGQVFQNLISNALKFHGPDPPIISIRGERQGPDVVYSVTDNGLGIPAEFRERVFVIFERLHRREEYPGTGLGLAIAKRVIERHGGTIWVESGVPRGSTFWIRLPRRHVRTTPVRPVVVEPPAPYDARRVAEDLIARRLKDLV